MWNTVLGLIITASITVVTYFLGGSLKGTKVEKIMKVAGAIIKVAVSSTEQLSANKGMTSVEKKALAIKNANDALAKAGIKLSSSVVDMMIESEVYALKFFHKG